MKNAMILIAHVIITIIMMNVDAPFKMAVFDANRHVSFSLIILLHFLQFEACSDKLCNVSPCIIRHIDIDDAGTPSILATYGFCNQFPAFRRSKIIDADLLRHRSMVQLVRQRGEGKIR